MNIAEFTAEVAAQTGLPESGVAELVRSNWPAHFDFKNVQARLLVALINRKKENRK